MAWQKLINSVTTKTFSTYNFGCRVNAAETNQFRQLLIDSGFIPTQTDPGLVLVNTCAITSKGEYESLARIRVLSQNHPDSLIIATGCADLKKISHLPNVHPISNIKKEKILNRLQGSYSPQIKDKFSHSHKFILKIQTGCTAHCSYCIVPSKRQPVTSLPIDEAVSTINNIVSQGYQEVILTGINLNQYTPGLSNLLKAILTQTQIPKVSFGSLPLNCIDQDFIKTIENDKLRIDNFLHIPLQSGSDKILKLMNRPYTRKDILQKINNLKLKIQNLKLGTDIIIGFPTETDADFKQTYDLCQSIGFSKIHVFKYSSRPNTKAATLPNQIKGDIIQKRAYIVRSLSK